MNIEKEYKTTKTLNLHDFGFFNFKKKYLIERFINNKKYQLNKIEKEIFNTIDINKLDEIYQFKKEYNDSSKYMVFNEILYTKENIDLKKLIEELPHSFNSKELQGPLRYLYPSISDINVVNKIPLLYLDNIIVIELEYIFKDIFQL